MGSWQLIKRNNFLQWLQTCIFVRKQLFVQNNDIEQTFHGWAALLGNHCRCQNRARTQDRCHYSISIQLQQCFLWLRVWICLLWFWVVKTREQCWRKQIRETFQEKGYTRSISQYGLRIDVICSGRRKLWDCILGWSFKKGSYLGCSLPTSYRWMYFNFWFAKAFILLVK